MHIAIGVIVIVSIAGAALVGMMAVTQQQQELVDIRTEVQQRQTEALEVMLDGEFTSLAGAGYSDDDPGMINGTIRVTNTGQAPVEIVQIRVYDQATGEIVDVIPVYVRVDNFDSETIDVSDIPGLQEWLLCEQTGEGRHPLWYDGWRNDTHANPINNAEPTNPGFAEYYANVMYAPDRHKWIEPGPPPYDEVLLNASKQWAFSKFAGGDNICLDPQAGGFGGG